MEQEPKTPEQSGFTNPELERPEATKGPEHSAETAHETEQQMESARRKIENESQPEHSPAAREAEAKRPQHSGLNRRQAYTETMASLQRHLPTLSRGFSKLIHNPVVDKTSEAVGQTVLRPSVTLGATSTALIVGGITYLISKHYGYHLSGSVILLSLVLGGIIGLLFEGIAKLFRRKT